MLRTILEILCLGGILRFGVVSTEAHEPFFDFQFFPDGDLLLEFLGNGRADGVAAHRNASTEDALVLDEDEICRARSDIDQKRATAQIAVVVTKSIGERHRRDVENEAPQAPAVDGGVDFVELFRLDRN